MWLLDANVWIDLLNGKSPRVDARLRALDPADIRNCSVAKAEVLLGVAKGRPTPQREAHIRTTLALYESLPFDDDAAERYAVLRAYLERMGQRIGYNDMLIAAIALANDVTVVTRNVREFARVPGLRVEDWESEPQPT